MMSYSEMKGRVYATLRAFEINVIEKLTSVELDLYLIHFMARKS